jgi:hypothetical protein
VTTIMPSGAMPSGADASAGARVVSPIGGHRVTSRGPVTVAEVAVLEYGTQPLGVALMNVIVVSIIDVGSVTTVMLVSMVGAGAGAGAAVEAPAGSGQRVTSDGGAGWFDGPASALPSVVPGAPLSSAELPLVGSDGNGSTKVVSGKDGADAAGSEGTALLGALGTSGLELKDSLVVLGDEASVDCEGWPGTATSLMGSGTELAIHGPVLEAPSEGSALQSTFPEAGEAASVGIVVGTGVMLFAGSDAGSSVGTEILAEVAQVLSGKGFWVMGSGKLLTDPELSVGTWHGCPVLSRGPGTASVVAMTGEGTGSPAAVDSGHGVTGLLGSATGICPGS